MKIVRMSAENVKRIEAVEITPDGNMIVVGGKNGAGKSSVLDAIQYALAGKAAMCSEPIRRGEDSANIVCAIGEDPEKPDIIVRRRFTEKGSSLSVENADGAKFPSPQALLDKLTGFLTFDPLEFSRMDQKTRREALLTILGLDFADVDAQIHGLYDKRTDANREAKRLDALLKSMAQPAADVPDVAPSGDEIVARLNDAVRITNERDDAERNAAHQTRIKGEADESLLYVTQTLKSCETALGEARATEKRCFQVMSKYDIPAIETEQKKLAAHLKQALAYDSEYKIAGAHVYSCTREKDEAEQIADKREKELRACEKTERDALVRQNQARLKASNVDVVAAQKELENLNTFASAIRSKAAYNQTSRELVRARTASAECSNQMDDLLDQKMKAVADANLPVDGLALSETGDITLDGLPFDQASGADQLRVSVAMAIEANPDLRIMLIRDGSLLDEDSLAILASMAADADAQVWIERVGNDEHVTVLIEDGFVAAPSDLDNEGPE